ncbi:hypothetical protein BO86DRAFT_308135 [Aspergillus japonicus CBS 114.51]|uniref:Uncharacterized protein n=2 Tax=Aspergillus TaxID=5052 RepID=A0A2V5H572_ASPV1|nr:hypothetical protein BO86DRAFT_308135 [Aspergillus japonicus CBS 114.51]PYI16754.1 hypothetical protein BO99DRAFT_339524 [Aspergillus violaceofuscus CBS 115571]RAH83989.1 hypothetical protein BO86DRAFT_308135 [Aspergillus japonicus CBS 114.51]
MESVRLSHPESTHSNLNPGMLPNSAWSDNTRRSDQQAHITSPLGQRIALRANDRRRNDEQLLGDDRIPDQGPRLREGPVSSFNNSGSVSASVYAPQRTHVPIEMQLTTERDGRESQAEMGLCRESQDLALASNTGSPNCGRRSCTSIFAERKVRRRLITLTASGVFLLAVVAVYLAFAASRTTLGRELQILLIFMILIIGIVFCHALTRFLMAIVPRPDSEIATNRIPSRAGPSGYAQPSHPIHVVLAADEDSMTESRDAAREKITAPPPAYGLWRGSVRLNPDLLYWQRVNKNSPLPKVDECGPNKSQIPRPPSYISDNGIDYVVEAQPRSFAQWHAPEESARWH